jgi:WD40-like Beta Propeller Repeat
MSAFPQRIARPVTLVVIACVLASAFTITRSTRAEGKALLFVLFMMDKTPYVMRSDGSGKREIPVRLDGEDVEPSSRDFPMAIYNADAALNEVLMRLNAPAGADYADSEIAYNNPLITGTSAWQLITNDEGIDGDGVFGTTASIAFVSDRDGDNEIYTIDTDGTGLMQLTDNTANDIEPAYMPSGQIAFTSDRDGSNDIWLMNSDGTGQLKPAFNSDASDSQPDVSADGTEIAITSDRAGSPDIWLLHADLSEPTRLTNGVGTERDPVWSPDSTMLFFTAGYDGDLEVYSMTPEGEVLAQLTYNDKADYAMDATYIPPVHERSLILKIDREGVATGAVVDLYGLPACSQGVKVFLQRKTTRGWQPVAENRTNEASKFRMAAAATAGTHRVIVARHKPPVPLRDVVCGRAVSRSV